MSSPRVAVLIPCLNEAATVGKVVADFAAAVPGAEIVVIDNGCTDATASIARAAGASVIAEPRRGKGRALRTAFRRTRADVFLLADGDDQQPADRAMALLGPVVTGTADMVVGSRSLGSDAQARPINRVGNRMFSLALRLLLGVTVTDVLSGYRAISADAVRALDLSSPSFEVEVELTIKAAERRLRMQEVPISVRARQGGSVPRIRVVRDGLRIAAAIVVLLLRGRPARFFVPLGAALLGLAAVLLLLDPGRAAGAPGPWLVVLEAVLALAGIASLGAAIALRPVAAALASPDPAPETVAVVPPQP